MALFLALKLEIKKCFKSVILKQVKPRYTFALNLFILLISVIFTIDNHITF